MLLAFLQEDEAVLAAELQVAELVAAFKGEAAPADGAGEAPGANQ